MYRIKPGDDVDGFRVGEAIARGGLSDIYHCTHPAHDRPLVIKVPRLGGDAPRLAFTAFENEVRVLERLKLACTPHVEAIGDLFSTPYIVMEYLEGDEFARAEREAPIAIDRLRDLGARLARAVHNLHRHNVIHLDLNPRNVRNRADGEPVLIDFGLAHHARLPDLIDSAFGEEEGTTAYISPEQVKHVRTDLRSDVYALGAILYRLATGEYPFGRPNLMSLQKRLHEVAHPPRCHRPDLPPWLQEIILRCLERHPRDRYATAKRVAYALAHPGSVTLTARAFLDRPESWPARARRWFQTLTDTFDDEPGIPLERLAAAPHVLVALDLDHASDSLRASLRQAVRKFVRSEPHCYLTVLTVVPPTGGKDATPPDSARLIELNHWAQPLKLDESRVYYQALPGSDAATTLVEYARHHQVDHIIMGARASSAVRRYLGSVSARVVAEAACTVTVVRSHRDLAPGRPSPTADRPDDGS
jgi:serine/threonine protein kinase